MTARPGRNPVLPRAVQVTAAAGAGFYAFLYGLDQPVSALYAIFAPIALGLLSTVPGTGRAQAALTVKALPAAVLLVLLGTALAVATSAAVAGMLVVGFVLSFAAVAGARVGGAAPGLQLLYILACFPPYAPQTLGARLTGLVVGVLLLAAAEVLLLPGPVPPTYRDVLCDGLRAAATAVRDPDRVTPADLRGRGEALRLSNVAAGECPAGPGRRDRALAQAGAAVRRVLEQLATWAGGPDPHDRPPGPDRAAAALLDRVAGDCAATEGALRARGRPPSPAALEEAIRLFQAERIESTAEAPRRGPGTAVLRRQAAVLALAESTWMAVTAVGVADGGRLRGPLPPREVFWYATLSTPRLWARRIAGNLTHRSVWFQNAVRVSAGLAAARLVAGTLDLAHGFWVLLAVLTLGRTTAGATWRAVRLALVGTLVGAVAAGALLAGLGWHPAVYAILLVPGMLAAFVLGPRLGVAYAQGLFTLVVALIFAQITPTSWHLSEERIVDVVTGSAIGLLCGLLAWPAGARREVRRTMAALLHACGGLIPATVDCLLAPPGRGTDPPETFPALHRLRLAEAAYAQYRSEPPAAREGAPVDWHAVLIVAYQSVLGAQRLPRFESAARDAPPGARDWACRTAAGLADDADRIAGLFSHPDGARPGRSPRALPPDHRAALPTVVDLEVWLTGIDRQLTRIEASVGPEPGRGSTSEAAPGG
ncbi:FUSC family protein [Streptomyces tropicalis]|uniref:FUSC family protein n=1 Tax=Streptomyces tropicalis TaxID=3034234 RepID=A0ABT6A6L6_9ACTN|nr:FUSC family protein [Streptomyces tropicalis]MDF3300278.1 FUSC family protein [Streptomyces tropicalis]